MFKKILVITALTAVVGVLVYGAVYRTQAKTASVSQQVGTGGYGRNNSEFTLSDQRKNIDTQQNNHHGGYKRDDDYIDNNVVEALTSNELSAEEVAALTYMREEEKLAHDVYAMLYAQWGLPLFQNISQSEQTHSEAVKTLLDRYGLEDPASGEVGIFTNPDFQALYNDLLVRGSLSLADALTVGAEIEEIDILDLEKDLSLVDNADIRQVFNNLLEGSSNHLRTFVSRLNSETGEVYQPRYLSEEAYQAIIGADTGNGNRGGSSQGEKRGGNGQGGNGDNRGSKGNRS